MMEKLLAALTIMSTIFILTWLLRWLKPFPPAAPPPSKKSTEGFGADVDPFRCLCINS